MAGVGFALFITITAVYVLMGKEARTMGWGKIRNRVILAIFSKDQRFELVQSQVIPNAFRIKGQGSTFLMAKGSMHIGRQGVRLAPAWRHYGALVKPDIALQGTLLRSLFKVNSYEESVRFLMDKAFREILEDKLFQQAKTLIDNVTKKPLIDKEVRLNDKSMFKEIKEAINATKERLELHPVPEIKDDQGNVIEPATNSYALLIKESQVQVQNFVSNPTRPNPDFIKKYGHYLDLKIAGVTIPFEALDSWRSAMSPEKINDIVREEINVYREHQSKDPTMMVAKWVSIGLFVFFVLFGLTVLITQTGITF